jgi:hypothetical protein
MRKLGSRSAYFDLLRHSEVYFVTAFLRLFLHLLRKVREGRLHNYQFCRVS